MEFGVAPKRVKYLASIETTILGLDKPVSVHVVEYEMPDGTYGKGFVNPLTWSFAGPLPYDRLTNAQLVTAYAGWFWIFNALHNKQVVTEFQPTTLNAFLRGLEHEGIDNVVVKDTYKVMDSELFEFSGQRAGARIKGAGSIESKLVLDAAAPEASLPMIYSYLGLVMNGQL
jgi:hypothetical protein